MLRLKQNNKFIITHGFLFQKCQLRLFYKFIGIIINYVTLISYLMWNYSNWDVIYVFFLHHIDFLVSASHAEETISASSNYIRHLLTLLSRQCSSWEIGIRPRLLSQQSSNKVQFWNPRNCPCVRSKLSKKDNIINLFFKKEPFSYNFIKRYIASQY